MVGSHLSGESTGAMLVGHILDDLEVLPLWAGRRLGKHRHTLAHGNLLPNARTGVVSEAPHNPQVLEALLVSIQN